MQEKTSKTKKMNCANPLVQAYSSEKEATVTTDASEQLTVFFRKKDIQLYMYREGWLQRSKTTRT